MENIAVCLRIRPMNQREVAGNEQPAWRIVGESKVQQIGKPVSYEFNNCFEPEHDNFHIFQSAVKSVILYCLEGINGTIFMYGQTGSGKTFTMLGAKKTELQKKNTIALQQFIKQSFHRKEFNDIGVLVYSLMEIFKEINKDESRQFELKCSYYEIYNENVYDLLRGSTDFPESIQVVVDRKKVGSSGDLFFQEFILKGLVSESVTSLEEVIEIVHRGERNRHYAETILNHQSSRSHTIFRVQVSAFLPEDGELRCSTEAVINFIDLAGSEKIANHQQVIDEGRERMKESQSINKSLFYLTRVIALKTQKVTPPHIPFRNSTLTKLMKASLSGNCRTLIILCIPPTVSHGEQSVSTMRFGVSARLIENRVEQNLQFQDSQGAPKSESLMLLAYSKMKEHDQTVVEQQETIERLTQQVSMLQSQKETLVQQLKWQSGNVAQEAIGNSVKSVQRSESVDLGEDGEEVTCQEKLKQASRQLFAQQEKNAILERQQQDMFRQIVTLGEQVREQQADSGELEVALKGVVQLWGNKEIISELKSQNERLRKFASQALSRLEFYENGKGLEAIAVDELVELEETLKQSLTKVQAEIRSVTSSKDSGGIEVKSASAKRLVGVNKGSRSKNLSPTCTPFRKEDSRKPKPKSSTPIKTSDAKRSQSSSGEREEQAGSLASRLHRLTEKIEVRKEATKRKPLEVANKAWDASEVIYETDSEVWIDSCSSMRK